MTFDDHLAPVIPLFGGSAPAATPEQGSPGEFEPGAPSDGAWHTTWTGPEGAAESPVEPDEAEYRELAEKRLMKKLRVRSLSEREARAFLREHDVSPEGIEHVIDALLRHGYLDDVRLSEQLIYAGITRKGQGRQAISLALAQRGVPRDVADAALAELADDDAERALEFARQKARAMRGLDREVAVRRLVGQLSRRGYGGSALSVARQALSELERPAARGVRFD
ncbi:regulatory protein RecX [Microbacterium sp.]|uniref:regulatory protein RecX n=1 Tax=Microbacterium sp. TaxID=51671 RepID=UPI0025E718EF|nr:regulatory protein RecX [Microbacterium sp.]